MLDLVQSRPSVMPYNLDWSNPLTQGLAAVYLPLAGGEEVEPLTRVAMSKTGAPTIGVTGQWKQGWANNGSSSVYVGTNWVEGLAKNQSLYSIVMFCRVLGTPGAANNAQFYAEPTSNSSVNFRLSLLISNGQFGATGLKWDFSFRTGNSASTQRDVNAGAGGITVAANTEYMVSATFDSVADLYTLFVNSQQEAQLSVAESTVANTNPTSTPTILNRPDGLKGANGVISGIYGWRGRVLTARDIQSLYLRPWQIFLPDAKQWWAHWPTLAGGIVTGSASLQSASTLTADGVWMALGSGNLQGASILTASGVWIALGSGNLQGASTITSDGVRMALGSGNIQGVASLTSVAAGVLSGSLSIQGASVLSASSIAVLLGNANLQGVGSLSATAGTSASTIIVVVGKAVADFIRRSGVSDSVRRVGSGDSTKTAGLEDSTIEVGVADFIKLIGGKC